MAFVGKFIPVPKTQLKDLILRCWPKRKDRTFSFSFFVRCCKYGSSAPAAVGFFMLLVYGMKLFCVGFGSPCAGDEGAAQQGQDERRAESQV